MPTAELAPSPLHPLLMPPETQEFGPERLTPIGILERRKESGYRPGEDEDGHKVGLAMDPGGYAGVVSLAMAAELDKLGLLDYVDGYYGVSVGNINALYVATKQFEEGLDVYTDLMPGRFSTKRKSGLPQAHLDVLEQAIMKDRPFKPERLPEKVPVVIGVTRLDTSDKKVKFRSSDMPIGEFIKWALRGCHLPGLMPKPEQAEDGHYYSDSTLTWMSAIELAEEDGCTEIISLANVLPKKRGLPGKMAVGAMKKYGDWFMNQYDPEAKDKNPLLASSIEEGRYEQLIELKESLGDHIRGTLFIDDNGAVVERLYPHQMEGLPGLMTSERRSMVTGMHAGALAVQNHLEVDYIEEKAA